jgi:hypothetical protein
LAFEPSDRAYLLAAFSALRAAFPAGVPPDPPLDLISARALMRLMLDLRRTLRPDGAEQRAALGHLAGALVLLDAAGTFARERDRMQSRRTRPPVDPDHSSS